ncbi:AraC family transcriptional regulator [Puniceibacterium sediminis]|uniref:AraC-type DNA-binding protein n=1 Tax=Puniceibacterium sediminis TaxID=1608407 RepID=A0A238Z3Q8_9RHOB|nr:AraC family transcriptional regulator [Puniceibacterium sediminis]SNR78016.1 AraC-type DNA-binding protein [Puniceibacterium sediminis]
MGGYVKASALSPIQGCVERYGGRIDRVLRSADLPLQILDRPDLALPLKDHYAVLQAAAKETGLAHFGAEMGALAKITMLGKYGSDSTAAPTLGAAVNRLNATLNQMMQTDTDLVLFRLHDGVKWSMVFHTRGDTGRWQNELLAIGYQLDLLRHFLGRTWRPRCIHLRTASSAEAADIAQIFGSPVRKNSFVPGIEFDGHLLATGNTTAHHGTDTTAQQDRMPDRSNMLSAVRAAIRIELLHGRPVIDRVSARLQVSRRSLQRQLSAEGTTYGQILADALYHEARSLLADECSIGEIADRLGYADHAHFTRAYRRWTGFAPREHRALAALYDVRHQLS